VGKIFISHSSANNAEALAIHDWLGEQGWGDVFLDLDPRRGIVAGDRWQAALKAAAEQCELILILISPQWAASRWCLAEFLLAKQMNKQILAAIVQPTPLADLPVELTAEWQLVDLSAGDPGWATTIAPPRFESETRIAFSGTGLARLGAGLEKAGLGATTFPWPPAADPGRAPYRGLKPLEAEDAGIFFGRDGALILTMDRLRGLKSAAKPRFATILGASGAGKSSFLRAGLLPRLARDSRNFTVLPVLRPERAALTGEHGLANVLDAALRARGLVRNRADLRAAVTGGAAGVRPLLRDLARAIDPGDVAADGQPVLVLAIDQAEELLSADTSEAGAFLTLIAQLAAEDDPALLVLLTVRSDSFDALQNRPELASTQPHQLIDLPPIAPGSFGDIVRGPARRAAAAGRKLVVEEPLVDALLADIADGGTKDALPLLSFTLERLFTDFGADGDLTLPEYEKLGRIRGAIEAAVEAALARADGNAAIPRDHAARLVLLRRGLIPWLAGIDPATGAPRRRVARLAEVPTEARPLIDLLVEARLLSTDVDHATNETTIEPAHEAILRQWGALDGWLAEDAADLSLIEALRRAATDWDANARSADFLVHTGARLATARQVAGDERFATYLTSVDRAYLDAAQAAQAAADRRARALRRRLTLAATVAGIVLVAGATAGYFLYTAGEAARRDAAASFAVAKSWAAQRTGAYEVAAAEALNAYHIQPTTLTRTAFVSSALAVSPYAAAVVPADERIADIAWRDPEHPVALDGKGALTTLDLAMRRSAIAPATLSPAPIAEFADGQGGLVLLRPDASLVHEDGAPLAAAPADEFAVKAGTAVATADGKLVAMIGLAGDVLYRDCRALPCADTRLPIDTAALALSPDGALLAVAGSDGTVRISKIGSAAGANFVPLDDKAVALAWSADGHHLAIGTAAPALALVDPDSTAPPTRVPLEVKPAVLAWSPDATTLAVNCTGNDICLLDATGTLHARLAGHVGPISLLRWSGDGTSLASAARNDALRLWTATPSPGLAGVRRVSADPLTTLAVDRKTGRILAGDKAGRITVLGADVPQAIAPPAGVTAPVAALAPLADGRIAAVYQNAAVAVWTLGKDAPDALVTLDNLSLSRLATLSGDIRVAVPLSDKSVLVLTGDNLREARIAPGAIPLDQWGVTAAPAANSAFFSYSDGAIRRRDLGAGGEGTLVYDASKSLCGAAPTSDNNGARSLDVSPDGKWLVATRTDDTIIVHNLADPAAPLCLTLAARDSRVVAFSPDSRRLALLGATDRISVFDLSASGAPLLRDIPATSDVARNRANSNGRLAAWLAWQDDTTLLVATAAGTIESFALDEAGWQARVDSLAFGQ